MAYLTAPRAVAGHAQNCNCSECAQGRLLAKLRERAVKLGIAPEAPLVTVTNDDILVMAALVMDHQRLPEYALADLDLKTIINQTSQGVVTMLPVYNTIDLFLEQNWPAHLAFPDPTLPKPVVQFHLGVHHSDDYYTTRVFWRCRCRKVHPHTTYECLKCSTMDEQGDPVRVDFLLANAARLNLNFDLVEKVKAAYEAAEAETGLDQESQWEAQAGMRDPDDEYDPDF